MSNPFDFGSYGASDSRQNPPNSAGGGSGFGTHSGFGAEPISDRPTSPGGPGAGGGFGGGSFGGAGFGENDGGHIGGFGGEPMVVGRPPVIWLYLGVAVAAAGAVLAALFADIVLAIPAWVLAGPIAIGFLTVFILADTKSQSAPIYSMQGYVPWLYRTLLLVAAVGVGLSAWRIATWVGHL